MFNLKFDMGNAAFGEYAEGEVKRILSVVIEKIDSCGVKIGDGSRIYDYNGNCIGSWEVTESE